ncbi:MAG: LytR/AlgR family response regulator transcription factor [Bacteroidota bacterium]
MNCVIIEDELPSARRLKRLIKAEGLRCLATLESVASARKWFAENTSPELLFVDIQLSDGLSFEIFDEVEISCPIIFTTAYDEYALRAFKLNSIDYLLKPIDENELKLALHQFKNQHQLSYSFADLQALLQNGFDHKTYKERFTIKIGAELKVFSTEEIQCFFSRDKATYMMLVNARNYPIDFSLDALEENLNPKQFFRVNRKFIVRFNAIHQIISYTNSRLKIDLKSPTEEAIIVSRERVKEFKNWLNQ